MKTQKSITSFLKDLKQEFVASIGLHLGLCIALLYAGNCAPTTEAKPRKVIQISTVNIPLKGEKQQATHNKNQQQDKSKDTKETKQPVKKEPKPPVKKEPKPPVKKEPKPPVKKEPKPPVKKEPKPPVKKQQQSQSNEEERRKLLEEMEREEQRKKLRESLAAEQNQQEQSPDGASTPQQGTGKVNLGDPELRSWVTKMQKAIQPYYTVTPTLLLQPHKKVVILRVRVNGAGQLIGDIEIDQSSGNRAIDEEGKKAVRLSMVKNNGKLPVPPKNFQTIINKNGFLIEIKVPKS